MRLRSIEEISVANRKHDLEGFGGAFVMCRCGAWFPTPDAYNMHRNEAVEMELSIRKPRENVVDDELLLRIAEVHRNAKPGKKTVAVAELLGVQTRSAGKYVTQARRAGLLDSAA